MCRHSANRRRLSSPRDRKACGLSWALPRELLLDIVGVSLLLEVIEGVGAHDPEIDTLEEENVGDALNRAATDDREHAEIVAVIECGSKVGSELNISPADRARNKRDRIGIEPLYGFSLTFSVFEDCLETLADGCGIEFRPRRPGTGYEREKHRRQCDNPSNSPSHGYVLRSVIMQDASTQFL